MDCLHCAEGRKAILLLQQPRAFQRTAPMSWCLLQWTYICSWPTGQRRGRGDFQSVLLGLKFPGQPSCCSNSILWYSGDAEERVFACLKSAFWNPKSDTSKLSLLLQGWLEETHSQSASYKCLWASQKAPSCRVHVSLCRCLELPHGSVAGGTHESVV